MGEFGLLKPQLAPMLKAANSYNWTVSAIHNHMVLEKPKLIFVHWSAQGNLNTITTQIKNALIAVGKQPGNVGQYNSGRASNATTTSGIHLIQLRQCNRFCKTPTLEVKQQYTSNQAMAPMA